MVTTALDTYRLWLGDPQIDESTKAELRSISEDAKEIEDRFYKDLEFGTGGLRGVIGAGTNRINIYTVGKVTQGLAQYINAEAVEDARSVVIAYDSRHKSPEFALEAALVLAGNGIKAYVFESLRPTPELSFAVRELKASAGIVITASHNPPEYNGYKVYGADGGQLVPQYAERVIEQIRGVKDFGKIRKLTRSQAEAKGLLQWIGEDIDRRYIEAVASVSRNADIVRQNAEDLKIVYTPLHGAGNLPVRGVLKEIGFQAVHIVDEQERPDPQFTTVASPNPEEREAFALAILLGQKVNADILIGTDPDCDRMGAVVKDANGEYFVLTGNQSGAIMVHYLLSSMKERNELPDNGVVIKTIVTSEMGAKIAEHYGIPTLNTLTGFKYIGEKMTEFEHTGQYSFIFGYEESYGYLAGTHCRDKDAVAASMLICEAAAYYKAQGKTLYDVLQELYLTYGYYSERLVSRTLKGKTGLQQIQAIMADWRTAPPENINGIKVDQVLDYARGIDGLPLEDVLKFVLEDGSWFCIRPSGTEPKIKIYFAVCKSDAGASEQALDGLIEAVLQRLDK
jgi:phosphoglucomutase